MITNPFNHKQSKYEVMHRISFIPKVAARFQRKWTRTALNQPNHNLHPLSVKSPLTGKIISLDKVEDQLFSSQILGQGVAIIPEAGLLTAPFNGRVIAIYPNSHGIGLVSDEGVELFIHVGIDTFKITGDLFEYHIDTPQPVKIGQPILSFDLETIKRMGYDLTTPIVITDMGKYQELRFTNQNCVYNGDSIIDMIFC